MSSTIPASKPITKWPFFVGDGLCIAGMIAILAMAERPLSGGVAAAAVVCLIIGIAIAIAPYLIDQDTRLRLAENSGEGLGVAQIKKVAGLAEQLTHTVSRSQSSAEQIEKALAGAEESNDRLVALIENQTPNPTQAGEHDKALAKIQETLSTLQSAVRILSDSIERLATRPVEKAVDVSSPLNDLRLQIATLAEELPATPKTGPAPVGTDTVPESPPPVTPVPAPAPREAPMEKANVDAIPPASQVPEPPAESAEAGNDPASEAEAPDDGTPRFVFNQHSTSLIATAYIGIGNKLYLRGEGPGLNWDQGVPMQFLSIGKWGWSALEVTEAITCRIYRNDDEPAIDGDIKIKPAELKEISPRF